MNWFMAVFSLASTAVLVIGGKRVVAPLVQRPVGTRAGELGDPRDDVAPAVDAADGAGGGEAAHG